MINLRLALDFADENTQAPLQKLGLLVLLKTFQRLGYFPLFREVPQRIIRHIAAWSGLEHIVSILESYETVGSRWRHTSKIRTLLGIKAFSNGGQQVMEEVFETACQTKDIIADIINVGIEELVRKCYELPAFSALLRTARRVRAKVNRRFYQQVYDSLGENQKGTISGLLVRNPDDLRSGWRLLKQEARKVTTKNMRTFIDHLRWLVSLNDGMHPLDSVPEAKLQRFASEALSLNVAQMNEMEEKKRYTLAVALIRTQTAAAIDDLTEMFSRTVAKMHNRGKQALDEYHQLHREKTENLIEILAQMLAVLDPSLPAVEQIEAITNIVGDNPEQIAQECEAYLGYAGNNYLPFLPKFYQNQRRNLFWFLETLQPKSTSSDKALEEAIIFLINNKNSRAKQLSIKASEKESEPKTILDLSWIPNKWWRVVTGKTSRDADVDKVDRRYFEICLCSQVWLELKSGDLFIEGSEKFGDWRNQLISWEEYNSSLETYCQQTGCTTNPNEFVKELKTWLTETIRRVDATFPANESVSIKDGEPVIHQYNRTEKPEGFAKIEQLIEQRLPEYDILDILSDTEHWLNWTKHFSPISGFETRLVYPQQGYIASTFCYGCNLGPTQTARSVKNLDRKQVAYINRRHVDEEKLLNANVEVINEYNKFALPKFWGSSKSASADGTKWDVYEQNLLSEYHIRYGGWGGIGYYHVSDTYIALFSNFIPCGVWEAVYILDGLLENKSDIRPDTLHADTQGQSETVFGLAHLLSIQLMPRIRNWKDLKFYLPSEDLSISHLNQLFSDTIDWNLIENHFHDMLRVAISISQGKIRSSTILRKLGTYSRKNKIYFAFRELGRVIRTVFLLDYIASIQLRQIIDIATNKSEWWNRFLKWVSFGGSLIRENNRKEQRKVIRYNHLVANLVIFHNVVTMTGIINQLIAEGYTVTEEILARIAPYQTEHINRFGSYTLNFDRVPPPIVSDLEL